MIKSYTAQKLLDDFMEERHALGYSYKTDEGCIRQFLSNFVEPDDGIIEFTKQYVLDNTRRKLNQCNNTVLRDISAINCFLRFVQREGYKVYCVPPKSLPQDSRNFRAYIFSEDEIQRILIAADSLTFSTQSPNRHYQVPVMFRILFNCGLRISELRSLRVCDVDMDERVLIVLDTKFHKSRLVPFSNEVAEALETYFSRVEYEGQNDWLFPSPKATGKYTSSGQQLHFAMLLRLAGIPHGGRGKGPRLHDIRHTFAVHCLNNWVRLGVDLMTALPVLARYMGHSDFKGTQKYLQLTAQMYPDIVSNMEEIFGALIPSLEVQHANI